MDDILNRILQACKLARDLEASLPRMANNPYAVLASCEEIAAAFNSAVSDLQVSWASPSLYPGHFFFQEPMPGSELGVLQLGLDIQATSAMAAAAELVASDDSIGRGRSFAGAAQQLTGEVVLPELGGPAESTGQRSSRRRRESSEARTVRIPARRTGNLDLPPDDGYTWRKYGQKVILGFIFPRSYYRCTHKSFYGCKATKKVQRLDSDPNMYEITYCGEHTCQTSPTPLILSSMPLASSEDNVGNPAGGEELMIGALQPPAAALSTSMEVGLLFSSGTGVGGGHREVHQSFQEPPPPATERERDGYVADLVDAILNSGSSSGSMDAIFHS